MLKLIKLEMKKFKIRGYVKGALITHLILLLFMLLPIHIQQYENDIFYEDFPMTFTLIDTIVKITFMVFASVLIARFIIEEYRNGTITLLFTYPISRKKLITAKLIIIAVFTFVNIIISNLIITYVLLQCNYFWDFIPGELTTSLLVTSLFKVFINALTSTFMALIPLYFGMRRNSVSTTILSSLIMVAIVCSNNNGDSLSSIVAIPVILAIIGASIAYLAVRKTERLDVTK
ncbi:MAG TPA: ABC transporter permease [Lachnospiraceae bacterium]|nr:ABC transporter permease [Lachnospiraceae bacterium]